MIEYRGFCADPDCRCWIWVLITFIIAILIGIFL